MQKTAPVSWTTDALALSPSPVRHHVRPNTLGGSRKRCNGVTYPRVPTLSEPAVRRTTRPKRWRSLCLVPPNYEERMDVIDVARLHGIELEIL